MSPRPNASPAEMYERYLVPGIHARWAPLLADRVDAKRGERVLDVACGTGVVARTLASRVGRDGSVVGVDVDADMLDVARGRAGAGSSDVEWRRADAAALPLPAASFDAVTCGQGLQFMAEPAAAVDEMRRVIAPGGRAAVSVWQGLDRHDLYRALLEAEARHLGGPVEAIATPFVFGGAEDLRRLLAGAFGGARVEVEEATREARFASPERFVALTLRAAASIVPEADMDAEARDAMVRAIGREIGGVLDGFVEGDEVVFPMHAYLAVARA